MSRIYIFIISAFLTLMSFSSFAQLEDYKGLRFFLIRTTFNNPNLPGNVPDHQVSIGIDAIGGNMEQGKLQFYYRSAFIADAIPTVLELFKGTAAEDVGETYLTTLIPGWVQVGYNVFANDFVCISPGIFAGDYWYTAMADFNFTVPQMQGIIEPSGWYGAAGPALFLDVAPVPNLPLVLHFESSYAFSSRWSESSGVEEDGNFNPDSPDPRFFKNRIEVRYDALFLGYRQINMLNRYDVTEPINNGSRSDFFLGVKF